MATTISTQDIVDAKRDIDDIGKAVNEKVIVSPRYGEDFKSLPMIAAEFQISSDAAEASAVSAAESANIAQSSANIAEAAATAATIGAGVFNTPEAGVDPVTGVADGAYFNVRSSSDESYVDEYQNVGGVATPTGKAYPSRNSKWDASSVVDGNLNQHERNKGIKSIAQLRLTAPAAKGDRVYLASANEDQGEGGGNFLATQKAGLVDNGGTIIASPNPLIFWVRQNVVEVTPEMFGAKGGDRSFDSYQALQSAFLCGKPVRLQSPQYYSSKSLYHRNSFTLKGNGYWGESQIFKTTSAVAELADVVCPNGLDLVSYAKDAVLIAYPEAGDYVHDVSIEGALLGKVYDGVVGDGYFMEGIVYYAPYIAQSMFKRMQLNACQYSFYIVSQWMCSFERVEGACHGGWVTGGLTGDSHRICTTSSYTACWSKNVFGSGAVAWSFYDTKSTTMRSCGTDGLGLDGAPAYACIRAEQSDITINGFGLEVAYTGAWIEAINSVINASGLFCYQYANYVANGSFIFRSIRSQVKLELSKLDFLNKTIGATLPVFVLAEDNSFFEIDNVRSDPPIQGMNTGNGWDVRALSGSHIIIDADGTRSEYDHDSTSLQFPSNGGRNVTNRAIQSENTTQDFGLTAPLGGRIGNNYFRLGLARLFTNSAGRARYTVNNVPTGDFDGYRIGGVDVHSDNTTAAALEGNMYYNKTTGKLCLFDGATWIEFAKVT